MAVKKVIHQNVDEIVSQGLFSSDGTPRTLSVDHFVDSVATWNTDLANKLDLSGGSLTGPLSVGGNVVIAGDLEVQGSQVIVDAEMIHLADNFVVLNSDVTATPQDAGIEVNRGTTNTSRRLWWDETNTRWTVDAYDFQAGKFIGHLEGNADTSTVWAAPVKVEIIGDAVGDAMLDGSGNIQINVTVDSTKHNHDAVYYTEAEVDGLLATKSDVGHDHDSVYYTETEVDAAISVLNSSIATKADAATTYSKTEVDGFLANKADIGDSYTKADADTLLGAKADAADVYDKTTVDNMVASAGFTPAYSVSTDGNGDTVIDFTVTP